MEGCAISDAADSGGEDQRCGGAGRGGWGYPLVGLCNLRGAEVLLVELRLAMVRAWHLGEGEGRAWVRGDEHFGEGALSHRLCVGGRALCVQRRCDPKVNLATLKIGGGPVFGAVCNGLPRPKRIKLG